MQTPTATTESYFVLMYLLPIRMPVSGIAVKLLPFSNTIKKQ
jgi:hypothetical protein